MLQPEDLKSLTFKITKKAHSRLVEITNQLGISQFQAVTVLLENADATDERLQEEAQRVKREWDQMYAEARKVRKDLMSKVRKLSDEELQAVLKGLEGQQSSGGE